MATARRLKAVVCGLPTVDYVARAGGLFCGVGAVDLLPAAAGEWGRPGGAVLYMSAALARAGIAARPLATIGEDADGARYRDACRAAGLAVDGLVQEPGQPTPRCLLIYRSDGSCGCLVSPATFRPRPAQLALAADADLVAIAAGDPVAGLDVLAQAGPKATVAWLVKDDPACFPPALTAALARRADVIFCNSAERPIVDEALARTAERAAALVFETLGSAGVRICVGAEVEYCPAEYVDAPDPTGAGDTFAGAALACLAAGGGPRQAAEQGTHSAAALLRSRQRLA